jgi:hypothetical protein
MKLRRKKSQVVNREPLTIEIGPTHGVKVGHVLTVPEVRQIPKPRGKGGARVPYPVRAADGRLICEVRRAAP